jgi:proline racemase
MSAGTPALSPRDTATGPDPAVVAVLLQACEYVEADEVERLALFQAAIVASNLRADHEDGDHLGVLAQNQFWGPAAARRDARTAAEVFLGEARRVRASGGPRSAAKLAVQVQGGGSVLRHRAAARLAKSLLADTVATTPAVDVLPAEISVTADA